MRSESCFFFFSDMLAVRKASGARGSCDVSAGDALRPRDRFGSKAAVSAGDRRRGDPVMRHLATQKVWTADGRNGSNPDSCSAASIADRCSALSRFDTMPSKPNLQAHRLEEGAAKKGAL